MVLCDQSYTSLDNPEALKMAVSVMPPIGVRLNEPEAAVHAWDRLPRCIFPGTLQTRRLSSVGSRGRVQLFQSCTWRMGLFYDYTRSSSGMQMSFGRCPGNHFYSVLKGKQRTAFRFATLQGRVIVKGEARTRAVLEGEESEVENSEEEEIEDGNVLSETLKMLNWPLICAQVAHFASTPMGISIARDAILTIGATKLQSERLLEQTADACALSQPLDFSGIEDLRALLADAMSGFVCDIESLCRVKSTLIAMQSVYDQLSGPHLPSVSPITGKRSSLQTLLSNCDLCSDLVLDIDYCLNCTRGTVLDQASPDLATARLRRQENMSALEALLKDTAAWIVKNGGMDSAIITRRRTRLCVAVRSSQKSLLPGGVTLDVSNTGTTSYIEPEPALNLNNEESRLAAAEEAEEIAVLEKLTLKLVDKADSIMELLQCITAIDLACARASHARWLGSVRPSFYDRVERTLTGSQGESNRYRMERTSTSYVHDAEDDALMMDIRGMQHPLLLGAVLPTLPLIQRVGIVKSYSSVKDSSRTSSSSGSAGNQKRPVPVDIEVKARLKVVTITGPNTGGKTATLKACGVAAIMAKAGLFLPASRQPLLPWFDMVVADIGDSQSLEKSLSTFSGHIKHLCSILEICTDRSLILLDEVGGGTDPAEGAALATAVLQHLSSTAWLTIATTHSAPLKALKDQDSRFENASVEFDLATLKPTYRVLWGVAGQSNALEIAESLGIEKKVVARAREIVTKLRPSQFGNQTADILVPLMQQRDELLDRSIQMARVLSKAQVLHSELNSAVDNLPKREWAWRKAEERAIKGDVARSKTKMDEVVDRFQVAMERKGAGKNPPSIHEAHSEITSILNDSMTDQDNTAIQELLSEGNADQAPGANVLHVGENVFVRNLGRTPATVIELPQKDTDFVTVRLGLLKMQVKPSDVRKTSRSGSVSTSASSDKMSTVAARKVENGQTIDSGDTDPKYDVAVRTSRNTLQLRGLTMEDAGRELNTALASKRPGSVLFVVHGVGTGKVKEAVLHTLERHPHVAKYEDESITNGGCTVVYIK